MLVSDDDERIAKARFWSTQSREPERHYEHKELGFNYRMSNVVAGIGRGQLKVIDERVAQKREIFAKYKEAFADISDIHMMPINDFNEPNCWLTCFTLAGGKVSPDEIMDALGAENIESRPIWKPMHLQPFFEKYDYIDNGGVSQKLFESGVCLPSDTNMTAEEQDKVISIVRALFE